MFVENWTSRSVLPFVIDPSPQQSFQDVGAIFLYLFESWGHRYSEWVNDLSRLLHQANSNTRSQDPWLFLLKLPQSPGHSTVPDSWTNVDYFHLSSELWVELTFYYSLRNINVLRVPLHPSPEHFHCIIFVYYNNLCQCMAGREIMTIYDACFQAWYHGMLHWQLLAVGPTHERNCDKCDGRGHIISLE